VLPALLLGAATALLLLRPTAGSRLGEVLPADPVEGRTGGRSPGGRGGRLTGPRGACLVAGVALVLLLGGPAGVVAGVSVALAGPRLLSGLEPSARRKEREELARDLPLALDLLAACLAGGAPLQPAVAAVAAALPGACGRRLSRVATALEVGTPPAEAWAPVAEGGGVGGPAARALARAGESGAPVATAVARLAADLRAEARSRGEQAAKRAGVLAVAPLGLCFLPAFVLLGVVPVVLGLAAPLLRQF
jgi:pilus assembly protein TadC